MGSKFRLLPQLMKLFPKNISTFYDIFMGSGAVSVNMLDLANKVVGNDNLPQLVELYHYFQSTPYNTLISDIDSTIETWGLSKTNKEAYFAFRSDYNTNPTPLKFFVLICHSYNNLVDFNREGMFTMGSGTGRSSFNNAIRARLPEYVRKLSGMYISNLDFRDFDYSKVCHNDFVYFDPPYLISDTKYGRAWGDTGGDSALYHICDGLNARGIRFGLSNVISNGECVNTELLEWSYKYNVHHLNIDYRYCNHQKRDKNAAADEVFITNYSM